MKYREIIRVIEQIPTKTAAGGFTTVNTTKFDTFARVTAKNAKRVLESGTLAFAKYLECTIRYMEAWQVELGTIIEYKGELYDVTSIVNVDERNREVTFHIVKHVSS